MAQETLSQKSRLSRQTIRRAILIVSFLILPATLFYISPIVILMGAAEGIATGSLLLFAALAVLSLGVSRLWCGWLCPMGAWQEICSPAIKRTVKDGRRNLVKYGVTVLWLGLIAYLFVGAGGIRAVDPFYGTVNGFSITSLETLAIAGFIFLGIFAAAFVLGRRGFCRVLCPIAALMIVGRKIRNAVGLAGAPPCGRCRPLHRLREMLEGLPDGPRRPRQGPGGGYGECRVHPLRCLRRRLPGGGHHLRRTGPVSTTILSWHQRPGRR
jgi:ferredoxin-type protein NapH